MAIPELHPPALLSAFPARRSAVYALGVLIVMNVFHSMDRVIFSVLIVPIRADLRLTDTQVGLIAGFAFALFYAVLGLPLGRLTDTRPRVPILAACMIVWSVMSALCGLAGNALQMVAARIGVGVGEAGCIPAAQSLIGDLFAPERRPLAVAVFQAGGIVGAMGGMALAGMIADHYGSRSAFYILGAPGVLVAGLAWLTVREPGRAWTRAPDGGGASFMTGMITAVWALLSKRAYVHVLIALSIGAFAGHGMGLWLPTFYSRTHGLSLSQIGLSAGIAAGLGGVIGAVAGGLVSERLIRRDRRWEVWFPACTYVLAIPLYLGLLASPDPRMAFAFQFFALMVISSGMGAAMSAILTTAAYQHRATAVALVLLTSSILGLGVGPLLVGMLSDGLAAAAGKASLRYALMAATVVFLLPIIHFLLAGRRLRAEAAEA